MGMPAYHKSLGIKARLPNHILQHGSQLERTTLIAPAQLKETMPVETGDLTAADSFGVTSHGC